MSGLCNNHHTGTVSGEHCHFITYIAISMPVRRPLACSLTTYYYHEAQPSNKHILSWWSGWEESGLQAHLVSACYGREGKMHQTLKSQMEVWFCLRWSVLRCCPSFPTKIPEGLDVWVGMALIKHILGKEVQCSWLCPCLLSHPASLLAQWHYALTWWPALAFVQVLFMETPF